MDIMTLAMSKPKEIHLRDYNLGGVSLEMIVLMSFQAGGGSVSEELDPKFWQDLNTNRPLRFVISTDMMGTAGGRIEIDGGTVLRKSGTPLQVSANSIFNFNGNAYHLQILIYRLNASNAKFCSKVETVAFPTS